VASSVSAEHGSEPQVGWRWLEAFASLHPVRLVVDPFWKPHFEEHLRRSGFGRNVQVAYVCMPLARFLNPNQLLFIRHHWWLFRVRRLLASSPRGLGAEAVAYVTLSATYFFPFALLGVRRLWWGPVGGGFDVPHEVKRGLPLRWQVSETVRTFVSRQVRGIAAWLKSRSSTDWFTVARTPAAAVELEQSLHLPVRAVIPEPIVLSVEVGAVVNGGARRRNHYAAGAQFAFVGDPRRPKKNFPLALRLFRLAQREEPACRLHVFGGYAPGAADAGVISHGMLQRAEFLSCLSQCDVLLFSSYREGYASTIREALALGLTVIVLPVGGNLAFADDPRVVVLEPSSIRHESELVRALHDAIMRTTNCTSHHFEPKDYTDEARRSINEWLAPPAL